MRRAALSLMLVSLMAIGCDAASSASLPPQPLEELAALYSKALATANEANEEDSKLWIKSSKDLDAAKARASRRAHATLTFLRTVEELPWPSEVEPTVRRLVKCSNTVYAYQKDGSDGKSRKELTGISAVRKYLALAGRMGAKCTVLANNLRLELGMDPPEPVGCSLLQFHGDLVAENGRVVVRTAGSNWSGTKPIHWPGDWTVRPTDGGQLEVVDVPTGIVLARTGTRVILSTADYQNPFNGDGEFLACGPASPG